MIPQYRALTKDGREVFGWLNYDEIEKSYFIMSNYWFRGKENKNLTSFCFHEVIPKTIAEYIGKNDKNNTPIYGSKDFGFGMTKGGDRVKNMWKGDKVIHDIIFFNGGFNSCLFTNDKFEITGKQYDKS